MIRMKVTHTAFQQHAICTYGLNKIWISINHFSSYYRQIIILCTIIRIQEHKLVESSEHFLNNLLELASWRAIKMHDLVSDPRKLFQLFL